MGPRKYRLGVVYLDEDGRVCLPHHCDEWPIGSWQDAEQFVADLRVLREGPMPCQGRWGD